MVDEMGTNQVNRRDVLQSGAVVGGGLLASAFVGGSVTAQASDDQTELQGYISHASYRKVTGADNVDCVPNVEGWGDTCYVERVAEDGDGETGVSVAVPDSSAGGGTSERYEAYTATADEAVELAGGPSGHGPWAEPCGTWVFVGDDETLATDSVYRVSTESGSAPADPDYEGVTATDSDGGDIGSPMDLVAVSLEQVPPAERWAQVGTLTRGGLDAGFGAATAMDGETAVVGADGEGAAYVYTLTDDGWGMEAKLGDEVAVIGSDVAISGETVLVDAPNDGLEQNDSVCVFTRTEDGWEQQGTLAPDDLEVDDGFASAFDVDGDTVVAGAPEADGTSEDSDGLVYVFTRSDGTWSQQAKLKDERTDVEDTAGGLGYDVAIDGDTVVAGAPYTIAYDRGYSDVGGAFVFTRSEERWSQQAVLRSDEPIDGDRQGQSVAIEADTAVVASHDAHKDDAFGDDAGAAWVYSREDTTWSQQAKLTPEDWDTHNWFGYSISLDGERLLVGSDVYEGLGNDAQGAAYIFTRSGTDWSQLVKLTADDGEPYDTFGSDVALSGDAAFICAEDERGGSAARSGSTYLFQR